MALGPRDLKSLVTLTGWDATELNNFRLQDGATFAQVASDLNMALNALNTEIQTDPVWSSLVSYQDAPDVEYRVGSSNGFSVHTEYARADAKRADTEGHMLPLLAYDRHLGWTWDYLRNARMSQLQADIADGIKDARDRFRLSILTRVLQRGDDSGSAKGLGSSGYSPGFATAAASTSVDFVPPTYGGAVFTSAHEHYVAIAGGAFTAAVFQDARAELREHGHEGPYEFIIGTSDETTVKGLTGFVPADNSWVEYGALQDRVRFSSQMDIGQGKYPIGAIEDFRVWVVSGMPQYYGFGWKSYGANSQRNPLRIRLHKGMSNLQVQAMPDPRSGSMAYPLQSLMMFMEFGVGVADRTNGTARYVNNAAWSDGTPT